MARGITDWEVSYIDQLGTYTGDTLGVSGGATENVIETGTLDSSTKIAMISSSLGDVTLSVPDGKSGQMLLLYAINVDSATGVLLTFASGDTFIVYDTINEFTLLIWSDSVSYKGWLPIVNTGTIG